MKISVAAAIVFAMTLITPAIYAEAPDFKSMPKIDAHIHVRTDNPAVFNTAEEYNFILFSPMVDHGQDDSVIEADTDMKFAIRRDHPDRFQFAVPLLAMKLSTPQGREREIQRLQRAFDNGALGVKAWKNIGMVYRDDDDSFLMIDDSRFDPVFGFIESQGKTLVAHIGEPKNCWLPLEKMTSLGDSSYFANHPEYHMYLHPEYPSHEEIMAARDRMLEKHPGLTFVGCHLASLEWDVDVLAAFLDRYPNAGVDTSARMCHFQAQDSGKVREFLIAYQDRILYGTDLILGDQTSESIESALKDTWERDWRYLSTDDTMSVPELHTPVKGLALSREVLEKLYYRNAVKWLPGIVQ